MKTEHTSGPWYIKKEGEMGFTIFYKIDDCGCKLQRLEHGLHMENCPLHAAAPDLLEALKDVFRNIPLEDSQRWFAHKAQKAIDKAEGR